MDTLCCLPDEVLQALSSHHRNLHLQEQVQLESKILHSGKCGIDGHISVGLVAMGFIPLTASKR